MARLRRLTLLLAAACSAPLVVRAQQNSATAGTLGPLALAVAEGGSTVAAVLCTPLAPYANLTLFDIATGQQLSSACEVTNVIEDFFRALPSNIEDAVASVEHSVLGSAGLVAQLGSDISSVVSNVETNLGALGLIPGSSINVTAAAELLIQKAKQEWDKKNSTNPNSNSCTPASYLQGAELPTQCVGPVFKITVDGGSCVTSLDDGKVTCSQPRVTLSKTAGSCNLKYKSADLITDVTCSNTTTYGTAQSGTFSKGAEVFNAAEVFEVTNPASLNLAFFTSTASASASPITGALRPNITGPGLPTVSVGPFNPQLPNISAGFNASLVEVAKLVQNALAPAVHDLQHDLQAVGPQTL